MSAYESLKLAFFSLIRGHKEQKYKPVILVTGCSSGIGRALSQLLENEHEYRVVLTAREKSIIKVKECIHENERLWVRPLDIKLGEDRVRLINEIQTQWGGVDILINNAGISYRAVVEHMDEVSELNQLRTNYLGPMALIRLVLPSMREKGRGKIINISSVSGMLAMPTMSSYTASKFALEGASESLWYEMKPLGIDVTLIQPGFINSNSFKKVYYSEKSKQATEEEQEYSDYYRHMTPFVEKMMDHSRTTPEAVAKTVLTVIKRSHPPLRVPATLDAVLFYYLRRLIPRTFFHQVLYRALPKANKWAINYSQSRDLPHKD